MILRPILAILTLAPAFAQSNFTAAFDKDRQVKLQGPVIRVEWSNPRAFLTVHTSDANWDVEIGNPLDLERDGWKRNTLKIGDVIRIEGNPARGPEFKAFATSVTLASTGRRVFAPAAAKSAAAAAHSPAPRWPDGQIRLGPPPGKKGYWGAASTNVLVENNAKIPMNNDGILVNLADADRVAPMQPWAKAVYLYRQRTLLKDDPFTRCLPPGGPRQFQTPHGFQFVEQKDVGRILLLLGGGNRNWRMIFADGRPQGQADEVVRSYYGNSVGHWEKDTLVVDTIGFNERFWFANGGLPHTEGLRLTERFTRTDLNTLKYDVTIDDPRTYTRPWNSGWTIQWVPDQEIQEYFCEESVESDLYTEEARK